MTHPTKAIMGTLLKDFVKVNRGTGTEEGLYSEKDLEATMARTELLDFHQTIDVDGIKVHYSSSPCWINGDEAVLDVRSAALLPAACQPGILLLSGCGSALDCHRCRRSTHMQLARESAEVA